MSDIRFKAFNFLRAFFCLAIIALHVLGYFPCFYTAEMRSKDPRFGTLFSHPFTLPTNAVGMLGVDVFFMLSGFLSSMSLCKLFSRDTSATTAIKWMTRRFLRLLTFYLPLIPLPFIIPDPLFWNDDGSVNWRQWSFFFFGQTQIGNVHDFVGSNNLWSTACDLRASFFLLIIFYSMYKFKLQDYRLPILFILLIAFIGCRAVIRQTHPCVDQFEPYFMTGQYHQTDLYYSIRKRERAHQYWQSKWTNGVPLPEIDPSECNVMNEYGKNLYMNVWARFSAFLIGSIMMHCYEYQRRASSITKTILAQMGIIGSLYWILSGVLSFNLGLMPFYDFTLNDIIGGALNTSAIAYLTFCAMTPDQSPFHSSPIKWLMRHDIWNRVADLSGWLYTLHLPVLLRMLENRALDHFEIEYTSCMKLSLVLFLATLPSSLVAKVFVETAMQGVRNKITFKKKRA